MSLEVVSSEAPSEVLLSSPEEAATDVVSEVSDDSSAELPALAPELVVEPEVGVDVALVEDEPWLLVGDVEEAVPVVVVLGEDVAVLLVGVALEAAVVDVGWDEL